MTSSPGHERRAASRRRPTPAPSAVNDVVRSTGEPLDESVQTEMSDRLGRSFDHVRVHTDATAASSADMVGAGAYTVGPHIVFATGRYAPGTATGRSLLAHELVHVVQQGSRTVPAGPLAVSHPQDSAEKQADRAADGSANASAGLEPVMVQRGFVSPVRHSGLHGSDAVIPLARFIQYVEEVERANTGDTPQETLSRIRVQYYGGEGRVDSAKFDQLIPDAQAYDAYTTFGESPDYVYSPRRLGSVSADASSHLLARADENAVGDNPSPYLLLPNGQQVDVGHLFLAMDALLHPRTSEPYTTYGVPSIDVSGWVADVGIASVWLTMAEGGSAHADDPVARDHRPRTEAEYFRASAPEQDLLGDIDAFGMQRQWASHPGSLSSAIRLFYSGTAGTGGVSSRYQAFTAGTGIRYTNAAGTVTWDAGQRAALISQIDRFNDLYGAGVGGTIWGSLFGPSHRAWPHTPAMLEMFLAWLKPRLEAELRAGAAPTP